MNARPFPSLALLLSALALVAPPDAAGQEVAGRWLLSVELDAGSGDATFVFEVDGNAISGTYSGTLGEQSVTGTIDGSSVTFGFSVDQVGDVSFRGTVEGTSMSGTCEYGMLGSGTFQGRRTEG